MAVEPPLPRYTINRLGNGIQVILPSKKNYLRISWYGLWLLVWLTIFLGGSTVLTLVAVEAASIARSAKTDPSGNSVLWILCSFAIVPLAILLSIGGGVLYSFLWQILGREIITVDSQGLTVMRQILGWKRQSDYARNDILDLRVSTPQRVKQFIPATLFQHLSGQHGMIAFDYGAKTFRFGLDIDEAEAKQIATKIRAWLPPLTKAG